MNECASTETTRDTAHAKCGWTETVKSNVNSFPFAHPQVVGPIPAEGAAEIPVNTGFCSFIGISCWKNWILEIEHKRTVHEKIPRMTWKYAKSQRLFNVKESVTTHGRGRCPQRSTWENVPGGRGRYIELSDSNTIFLLGRNGRIVKSQTSQ